MWAPSLGTFCLHFSHFLFSISDYLLVSFSFSSFSKCSWPMYCVFISCFESQQGKRWLTFCLYQCYFVTPFFFFCLSLFYNQQNLLPPPCCYFPLYWILFSTPFLPLWLSIFHCLSSLFPPQDPETALGRRSIQSYFPSPASTLLITHIYLASRVCQTHTYMHTKPVTSVCCQDNVFPEAYLPLPSLAKCLFVERKEKAAHVEWCLCSSIFLKKNERWSGMLMGSAIAAAQCAGWEGL